MHQASLGHRQIGSLQDKPTGELKTIDLTTQQNRQGTHRKRYENQLGLVCYTVRAAIERGISDVALSLLPTAAGRAGPRAHAPKAFSRGLLVRHAQLAATSHNDLALHFA